MSVLAIFSVGAFPKPTELLRLDRLNEMFAYDLLDSSEKGERVRTENNVKRTDISCSSWVACF